MKKEVPIINDLCFFVKKNLKHIKGSGLELSVFLQIGVSVEGTGEKINPKFRSTKF